MPVKTSYTPGEPAWIDLATPDLDASIAFYTGLFGWTAERGGEEVGGYTTLLQDGKQVGGAMSLQNEGQPVAWCSYIATDDTDKTLELVTSNGGTVLMPSMDVMDIGRMAILMDPAGGALGIWQAKTHKGFDVVAEEGTFSWTELSTRNRATAVPFYQEVFGWGLGGGDDYTEFQVNSQSIAGCMDMPEMVPAEVPSYWMPYFQAEDPATKAQQAASLGGTVLVPFMEMANVAFSVVMDPQGATFGLLKVKG